MGYFCISLDLRYPFFCEACLLGKLKGSAADPRYCQDCYEYISGLPKDNLKSVRWDKSGSVCYIDGKYWGTAPDGRPIYVMGEPREVIPDPPVETLPEARERGLECPEIPTGVSDSTKGSVDLWDKGGRGRPPKKLPLEEILKAHQNGVSLRGIAVNTRVGKSTVHRILAGRRAP